MEIQTGIERYFIEDENQNEIARITFLYEDENTIVLNHTFVDPLLRGQNIAHKLFMKVIDFAREQNLKIIPTCSYAVAKFEKTDEYNDVLYTK